MTHSETGEEYSAPVTAPETPELDETFEALLRFLRDCRGFDFHGYKRTSLMRRVRHRMDQVRVESYADYVDMLEVDPEEFNALFNTILINVTSFFRDVDAWDVIREEIIPAVLAERGPEDPIRVWSAGCASGQEAYSLAMLLAEALGIEAFRNRVKIYATDIDEHALNQARHAVYTTSEIESVPAPLLAKYFDKSGDRFLFSKDLRRAVIFGRNDLVQDAPISRIDLLVCRNTLMYFNADAQAKILGRLHFALAPRGFLFLGHAEMLLSNSQRFAPLHLKHRLFRKALGTHTGLENSEVRGAIADRTGDLSGLDPVRDLAFRASPIPQIVVTGDETVAMINLQAETMFGLSARDIGRLLRDLEVSYRPLELRNFLEQAKVERRSARIPEVEWKRPGLDTIWFEIHINPLVANDNGLLGVSIVFFDVTSNRLLVEKVVVTNRQLEGAYEELQSTNEELETTNEELQSTVEELETTNEELQSTNEELETMNEELQSTNDELQTINDTLRERTIEVDLARDFLDAVVNSVRMGLIVVDRDMTVIVWNRGCEELWGVRSDEAVGNALSTLDIGLPLDELRPLIGNAFVDPTFQTTVGLRAVTRRGRPTDVRVLCSPFKSTMNGSVNGALLLMESSSAE